MECPICYTDYDNDNHTPLVTFCCQNTLCMKCVKNISAEISTSSCCPWDKRRWVGRSVLNNFMNSTPPNYFETLRKRKQQESSNRLEMESNMRVLGSGALREEYEDRMRRERERFELEHREQLLLDQKIASDLEAENLDRLRLLQDLEQKDLLVARRIAEESQQSSSGTPVHHLEDDVEDMDEAEDEKGGRGEGLSRILRSPSGKEKENKKKSGSFVDLTVSRPVQTLLFFLFLFLLLRDDTA
eukprot:gene36856-49711_t